MEITRSTCYKKYRQGVNANIRCVCRKFTDTKQFPLCVSLCIWPFGELSGPSIQLSDLHYLCGITVLPVIPRAVEKLQSLKTLLPGQVLHASPKYFDLMTMLVALHVLTH